MDRLEDDRYSAAHWSRGSPRRGRSGPERRAQAAAARGMTPGAWLALALGVASAGVVSAFARWSAWWPHSDNRQNGVTLVGIAAAVLGVVALARALTRATWPARAWMLLAVGAAVALGVSAGYGLMVGATASAK